METADVFARVNRLPQRIKAAIAAALVLAILLSIVFSAVAHARRTALFATPLHAEQLAEVQERLAGWNVPFTPSADNVLVDAKRRSDLLLRLSIAGVPHAHVDASSDVLSKLGALTPQAVIDAQTRDALSGDIELGLRGVQGVQDARVIVAPAKRGYFADDLSREASASVRLQLAPGVQLLPQAVSGIRAFVAASVPGLRRENVTIVDDRGVALDDRAANEDGGDLQRSLQSALDGALGAGVAIVRVHVEYDPRALTTHDVRRAPLAAPPISTASSEERFDGDGKRYGHTETQTDRGSETRDMSATLPAGRISRISAAVFVDTSHGADLGQVRALAAATLGLDSKRGDSLAVESIAFAHALTAKKDGWWLAYGAIVPLLPVLALAGAALAAVRIAMPHAASFAHAIAQRSSIAATASAVSGVAPASVRGALEGEPTHAAAAIISALPAATAAAVLEMYPEHERAAIVRRMQRPAPPLLADAEQFIANA